MTGLFTLGAVADLVPTSYTGFTYGTGRRQRLSLLGTDLTTDGNEVVQESAKPYRDATLTVIAETDAGMLTLRGYADDAAEVVLVDDAGDARMVLVYSYSATKIEASELWQVTMLLLELTHPAPAGS